MHIINATIIEQIRLIRQYATDTITNIIATLLTGLTSLVCRLECSKIMFFEQTSSETRQHIIALTEVKMLTYVRIGTVHYTQEDTSVGQFFKHGASWEFMVCLSGSMAPDLGTTPTESDMQSATLWIFPGQHTHGWRGMAPCERAVFHFSQVPSELEQYLPDGGYYGMKLSPLDCDRIRALAEETIAAHKASSAFIGLQDSVLAGKLALIALRSIKPKQISSNEIALQKTQQALDWYSIHMSEGPDQVAVARAVNVSPSYLRRLFHLAHGMSPKQAFVNTRMQAVDELLNDTALTLETIAERVGFANASTLRRAIKDHFGFNARQLRKDRKFARYRFQGKSDLLTQT